MNAKEIDNIQFTRSALNEFRYQFNRMPTFQELRDKINIPELTTKGYKIRKLSKAELRKALDRLNYAVSKNKNQAICKIIK